MALNSPPKRINTLIRKYTCVVNEHGGPRFYPHQYQNQHTLNELDEVLRTASAADVNHKDAWGEPTLILAISSDKCVRRLLSVEGIDVNIVNEKGNTALIEASMAGNVSTVDLLLQNADIDINHRNKLGNTAFILAARSSRTFVVCSLLKDPELDVNATNNSGMTALMSACAHALDMVTVRLLLESKRIDVHWANKDGQTALLVASASARKVVQAYLDATASPETLDPVDKACIPPLQTNALDESAPTGTEAATMAQVSPVIAPTLVRSVSPFDSELDRAHAFDSSNEPVDIETAPVPSPARTSPPNVITSGASDESMENCESSSSPKSITFQDFSPAPPVISVSPVSKVQAQSPPVSNSFTAVSWFSCCISDPSSVFVPQTVSHRNVTVATHSGNESTLLPLSAVSHVIPAEADLHKSYAPSFPLSPTSWLAVDLLNTGFDPHLVQLCEQKLVVELGIASERILALFSPTEFNAEYLTGLGITVIGLQKHLLALHRKLFTQYTPRDVADQCLQNQVRTLEETVKMLEVALLDQKMVNKMEEHEQR